MEYYVVIFFEDIALFCTTYIKLSILTCFKHCSTYLANKWQSDVSYIIILHRCPIYNTLVYCNLNLSLWLSTDIYTEAH